MKILVTGSNGLLGQKLIERLQDAPNMVTIATARGPVALTQGVSIEMDITNQKQVKEVITFHKPNVVINTAAMTNVDQCEIEQEACWKSNVDAVSYLLEACKENNSHLVHLSTDFIFDGSMGPLDESAIPAPVNYYGESKLAAEKLITQSGISWCILRTVLVFGITKNMSRSNIVLWVKKNLEEGKSIQVVNDQWRTPTLAEDLAEGCYLAALKGAQGIYNISGKDFLSPYDIAMITADFFNLDHSFINPADSSTFKQIAERPLKTGFIIDKARKELGYEPHSFREGIGIMASQIS